MAKRFWAESRITGKKWEPDKSKTYPQFLMMYDSGYLAVVTEGYYNTLVEPLNPTLWKVVWGEKK